MLQYRSFNSAPIVFKSEFLFIQTPENIHRNTVIELLTALRARHPQPAQIHAILDKELRTLVTDNLFLLPLGPEQRHGQQIHKSERCFVY